MQQRARRALGNVSMNPSPWFLTSVPPQRLSSLRMMLLWTFSTEIHALSPIRVACSVDDSMSVPERREEPASASNGAFAPAAHEGEAHAGSDPGQASEETDRSIVIADAVHAPEDAEPFMDPSYEELWEGTDAVKLDIPDIPALDLDWGEEDDPA